jgi:hypothetical protein
MLNKGKMERLIVRRSLSPAYYFFLQNFADANRITVTVDRRIEERRRHVRRTFGERRREERRGAVPLSWSEGDFIVVRGTASAAQS